MGHSAICYSLRVSIVGLQVTRGNLEALTDAGTRRRNKSRKDYAQSLCWTFMDWSYLPHFTKSDLDDKEEMWTSRPERAQEIDDEVAGALLYTHYEYRCFSVASQKIERAQLHGDFFRRISDPDGTSLQKDNNTRLHDHRESNKSSREILTPGSAYRGNIEQITSFPKQSDASNIGLPFIRIALASVTNGNLEQEQLVLAGAGPVYVATGFSLSPRRIARSRA